MQSLSNSHSSLSSIEMRGVTQYIAFKMVKNTKRAKWPLWRSRVSLINWRTHLGTSSHSVFLQNCQSLGNCASESH